ncbi:chorismate mutase, partial [Acetobacteraceae bacterium AT-5844]
APPPAAEGASPAPDLAALRSEIDRIDTAMHDLLMQRAALSAHMAASRAKGGAATFRPGREAAILRRLLGRHTGPLPRPVVARLWRDVISSSLAQQGPFSMAVQDSADGQVAALARGHFGLLTPLRLHPSPPRVLSSVASGEASVAILPAPTEGEPPEAAWWVQMEAPRLQVVAGLPFLAGKDGVEPQAFIVAPIAPEPTGRDRTLLRLEPEAEHTRPRIAAAFAAIGMPARWLLRRDLPNPMALAEVDGFLTPNDPRLASLPFPRIQILGAYAEPETEDLPA